MQSRRLSKTRGAVGGLTLACAALVACSNPSTSPTPAGPQTVQVSYCSGFEPQWVAFQDGDGPWTRGAPTAAGGNTTFQYVFQTNRGGIARLQLSDGLTSLVVLYGAPAELATAGDTKALHCGDPVSKALLGTVIGLDTNESGVIGGGLSRTVANPAAGGHFGLSGLPSGPHDLIAARATRASGQTLLTRFIVRREVDLPDSATVAVLDFNSPEAFAPATATLTITGLGPEGASAGLRLITENSEVLVLPALSASQDVARPYAALPLAQLRPGDMQELLVSAITGSVNRSAQLYFRSPADRVLTLPAPLERPMFDTVATTPVLRLRARFVPQGDFDRATSISYQQGTGPATLVSVSMTAGYATLNAGGYDLVVPDLSGTAGFDPAWALHAGSRGLLWTAGRVGGTLGLGQDAVPSDGSTQWSAFDMDSIPGS